jgi:hypothetical protein
MDLILAVAMVEQNDMHFIAYEWSIFITVVALPALSTKWNQYVHSLKKTDCYSIFLPDFICKFKLYTKCSAWKLNVYFFPKQELTFATKTRYAVYRIAGLFRVELIFVGERFHEN